MISGYERLTSHRVWFVPNLMVWGLPGLGEVQMLIEEEVGSSRSVYYGSQSIGDAAQTVRFEDLIDHRGNHLPATITTPRVIVRPRSNRAAFVVGGEGASSFKIARDPEAPQPVAVDLLVIEMDL